MSKYSEYYKGCKNVILAVDSAKRVHGACLSEEELLDYTFKVAFVYRTSLKSFLSNETYRVAVFFQKALKYVRAIEESNDEVSEKIGEKYLSKLNNMANICLGLGNDWGVNVRKLGKFYVAEVDELEDTVLFSYTDKSSLVNCLFEYVEYALDYAGFKSEYMLDYVRSVHKDIVEGVVPVEYPRLAELRRNSIYVVKTPNTGKVVYLENLGGIANGRYERGII